MNNVSLSDILITAIDLTRSCAANENYFAWLSLDTNTLNGSTAIANYLANAALAFEEQADPILPVPIDLCEARDNLADILMSSELLSASELQNAVAAALLQARLDFPGAEPHLPATAERPSVSDKADLIFAYSPERAIADGVLIDVTPSPSI